MYDLTLQTRFEYIRLLQARGSAPAVAAVTFASPRVGDNDYTHAFKVAGFEIVFKKWRPGGSRALRGAARAGPPFPGLRAGGAVAAGRPEGAERRPGGGGARGA
jgi:hypothetical protein